MGNENIGYNFYKKIYEGKEEVLLENIKNDKGTIKLDNNTVLEKIFNLKLTEKKEKYTNQNFKMKTIYPGLFIGGGYNHDSGLEDDFKLGFFFDYTTGLPIIPGSSVKGVLRNAFKCSYDYINDLIEEINKEKKDIDIQKLEKEIFEGIKDQHKLPMNVRDIFYDTEVIKGDKNSKVLTEDYLCPHGDNPLKNPTPLKFLKILPNVEFEFRFDLKDGIITKDEKLELFRKIILDLGIGSKTNVGYGQFDQEFSEKEKIMKEQQKLDSMSDIEREIYLLKKLNLEDWNEILISYNKLEDFEGKEKGKLAEQLKNKFIEVKKWSEKPSKKQHEKIKKIKGIIGEI